MLVGLDRFCTFFLPTIIIGIHKIMQLTVTVTVTTTKDGSNHNDNIKDNGRGALRTCLSLQVE